MRIDVITIFPEIFSCVIDVSMWMKARENGLFLYIWNLRDFSKSKQYKVDAPPFGGGAGMVLRVEPIYAAVEMLKSSSSYVVEFSPRGELFNQKTAVEFSKKRHLILLCGHYEGIDERAGSIVDKRVSIGDFVVTGGEVPAMLFIESVMRLLPGVLGNEKSHLNESFSFGLLEHPHYTRPRSYMGQKVPEVLLKGNHEEVRQWRVKKAYEYTEKQRPDLLTA